MAGRNLPPSTGGARGLQNRIRDLEANDDRYRKQQPPGEEQKQERKGKSLAGQDAGVGSQKTSRRSREKKSRGLEWGYS